MEIEIEIEIERGSGTLGKRRGSEGESVPWGSGGGEGVPGTAMEAGEEDFFVSIQNQGIQTFEAIALRKSCLVPFPFQKIKARFYLINQTNKNLS